MAKSEGPSFYLFIIIHVSEDLLKDSVSIVVRSHLD